MTIKKSASEVFRLSFSPTEDPDPRLLLYKVFLEALCSQINERFSTRWSNWWQGESRRRIVLTMCSLMEFCFSLEVQWEHNEICSSQDACKDQLSHVITYNLLP